MNITKKCCCLQDEEGGPPLGVIQEAEVSGDRLGHDLEVGLEAAKDARERTEHTHRMYETGIPQNVVT